MSFGKIIAHLRHKNNLSQEELAKRLNISKSSLGMYETNKREPSFDMTKKIADFFDVTTDYLLGRSDHSQLTEVEVKERDSDVEEWMKIIESLPEDERKEIEEQISDYAKYLVDKKQSDKN